MKLTSIFSQLLIRSSKSTRLPSLSLSSRAFSQALRFPFSTQIQPSNNSEPEKTGETNLFEKNKRELKELAKEIFQHIEKYSPKKKFEVFITYSAYDLVDAQSFSIIEKDFIRNLNSFTSAQLIQILESMVKINRGSPKFLMLIESYFLKHVHNLTPKECTQLARILARRDDAFSQSSVTSKRLCESLHLYFMNRINEFDTMQKMNVLIALLNLMKSRRSIYVESLELIYERIRPKIASLSKPEIVLFSHLFFSNFLRSRQMALYKREQAINSVNRIMQPVGIEYLKQQEAEQQQMQQQQQQQSTELFDSMGHFGSVSDEIVSQVLKQIESFTVKDYHVICQVFQANNLTVPFEIQAHLEEFVETNYIDFSPKEMFSIHPFISESYLTLYLSHYKDDLEYLDILHFFKSVSMKNSKEYKNALDVVDSRSIQNRGKWNLDESVYLFCVREDQEVNLRRGGEGVAEGFNENRVTFLNNVMQTINSELRISKSQSFKVYSTIWKVLFRSKLPLDAVFMVDLLVNMRNLQIATFEQYKHSVQILLYVQQEFPQFNDETKLTLLALEGKYAVSQSEEAKKVEKKEEEKVEDVKKLE